MSRMDEPLLPAEVKRLIIQILASGTVSFTGHAYEEMGKDNLTELDVRNTLRGGVAQPGELISGTYRYRLATSRMAAVVAFRSDVWVVVVTAWRM